MKVLSVTLLALVVSNAAGAQTCPDPNVDLSGLVEVYQGAGYISVAGFEVSGRSSSPNNPPYFRTVTTDEPKRNWCHDSFVNHTYLCRTLGDEDGEYEQSDWANGLNTLDLIRIQRHLLGVHPFDHLLQYVAADVNRDFEINDVDLKLIQEVLLGIRVTIPNQGPHAEDGDQPWVFTDKRSLVNAQERFERGSLPEWVFGLLTSLGATCNDVPIAHEFGSPATPYYSNTIAIKLGDVDFSADLSGLYD